MTDRSFLSQPEVIEASRNWICIRLATYESESEAQFLSGIFRGRSGQLENTVFALLSPDAKHFLAPAGRDPGRLYRDARDMADSLDRLASPFTGSSLATPRELPRIADLRLGLNVAACDGLPLVVVTSAAAEARLAPAAWSAENLGRAVYAREPLQGYPEGAYLMVPDSFGLKAEKVVPIAAEISSEAFSEQLASWREPPKDTRAHVREGQARGIRWNTKVPVTDPQGKY